MGPAQNALPEGPLQPQSPAALAWVKHQPLAVHSGDGLHGSRQQQQLSAQQHCGFQGSTSHMEDARGLPTAHWQAPEFGPAQGDPRLQHQPSVGFSPAAAAGSASPASLGAAQVLRQATQKPATSASVASAAEQQRRSPRRGPLRHALRFRSTPLTTITAASSSAATLRLPQMPVMRKWRWRCHLLECLHGALTQRQVRSATSAVPVLMPVACLSVVGIWRTSGTCMPWVYLFA